MMTSGGGMALSVIVALVLLAARCISGRAGMSAREGWAELWAARVRNVPPLKGADLWKP